jgi:hypothetical protein
VAARFRRPRSTNEVAQFGQVLRERQREQFLPYGEMLVDDRSGDPYGLGDIVDVRR